MSSKLMPPKVGSQGFDHLDQSVGVLAVQLQIVDVHVREQLEQHAFAFHNRLARQRADVAQAEHGCAVADHGHQIGTAREAGGFGGIGLDGAAGVGHAGE